MYTFVHHENTGKHLLACPRHKAGARVQVFKRNVHAHMSLNILEGLLKHHNQV